MRWTGNSLWLNFLAHERPSAATNQSESDMNDSTRALPRDPLAVTVKDACRLSGVGRTTIYQLIRDGKLTSTHVGGRRLILFKSLEDLIAA